MFPESLYFWKIQSNVIISATFPSFFLCNYVYTSASDCKGVGNLIGIHFVKAFSALPSHSELRHWHHRSPIPSMLISVEGTGSSQLEPGQNSMGDAPVLSPCSLLRNPWQKPTIVLVHCCEGETNCWFSIFRGVSFRPHPSEDEGCQYAFLYSL